MDMHASALHAQTYLTNSRRGSSRLERSATSDTVVLSPPGIIKASHFASSDGVRTSIKSHFTSALDIDSVEACFKRLMCS